MVFISRSLFVISQKLQKAKRLSELSHEQSE